MEGKFNMKYFTCKKCKKAVDILEIFPNDLCLGCHEVEYEKLSDEEKKPVFNENILNT